MLTIGVDPHNRLLVACAVNEAAQPLERWSGDNNRAGWESFLSWSASLAQPLQVAIEGTGSYGRWPRPLSRHPRVHRLRDQPSLDRPGPPLRSPPR